MQSRDTAKSTRAHDHEAAASAQCTQRRRTRLRCEYLNSEDEAVMGGAPVRGVLDAASQLTFGDLSDDSDDE